MTQETRRLRISEHFSDSLLFLDPPDYDDAILGVSTEFGGSTRVVYDFDKVIEINMALLECSWDEAREYYDFNQVGAYVGEHTPSYIHVYKNEDKGVVEEWLSC